MANRQRQWQQQQQQTATTPEKNVKQINHDNIKSSSNNTTTNTNSANINSAPHQQYTITNSEQKSRQSSRQINKTHKQFIRMYDGRSRKTSIHIETNTNPKQNTNHARAISRKHQSLRVVLDSHRVFFAMETNVTIKVSVAPRRASKLQIAQPFRDEVRHMPQHTLLHRTHRRFWRRQYSQIV